MADVTGRIYEAFTEFLLRRLGYRDEWTSGDGRQYRYEPNMQGQALCHRSADICPHAAECHAFSTQNRIPYGPWYDPDFVILENNVPVACLHVSHWSNPRDCCRKLWRTFEDHLQYKSFFGSSFLSLNLLFECTRSAKPFAVTDTLALLELEGWAPANGTMFVSNFDRSLLFAKAFRPLLDYVARLPDKLPSDSRQKRQVLLNHWESLYADDPLVQLAVDDAAELLRDALNATPHPRFTTDAVTALQDRCWLGRQRAIGIDETKSRYRKGIQHAFLLREMIARFWGNAVNADTALWNLLTATPRFPIADLPRLLGLPNYIPDTRVQEFIRLLAQTPVKMDQRQPLFLLNASSGVGHMAWDEDFSLFIHGLTHLSPQDLGHFKAALEDLFTLYRRAFGMPSVLDDLSDANRIRNKVAYVRQNYVGVQDRNRFIRTLANDLLTPGLMPPHQQTVPDTYNWVADVLLEFYDLGAMQHITTSLPARFEALCGHSLRPYAFRNNLGQLVSHLIAGEPVQTYFSRKVPLTAAQFYTAIWPLFAECIWDEIQGKTPLSAGDVEVNYRYKKAMRIISSPDLEPIKYLFRRSLPMFAEGTKGPTLRGCFNQLSRLRGWSGSALTTETTGRDPRTGAIIQTQSVFGKKNIDHKVKELAARMRSVHLRCNAQAVFEEEPHPGIHYLVVDGDWPVESKINLYEAGFSGIFEIGQLDALAATLAALPTTHEPLPPTASLDEGDGEDESS